jgi:XTP/dITP diphosphohydrolase
MKSSFFSKTVLATSNQGKLREFKAALQDFPLELIPSSTFNIPDIVETGITFVENALLKARHACKISQVPVLADDSGLVVPSLHGKPGVMSARYAGSDATDQANIDKLLANLKEKSQEERLAYFYCVLIFIVNPDDPTPLICQGKWEGSILEKPQGHHGFGYDPIFYVPTHQCSAAELTIAEKNYISHRGQALQILRSLLSPIVFSDYSEN